MVKEIGSLSFLTLQCCLDVVDWGIEWKLEIGNWKFREAAEDVV